MALLYATETELADHLAPETPPASAETWLIVASGIVRTATRTAIYDTTAAGLPDDPDVADAFRAATLAQIDAWIALDIDPTPGPGGVTTAVQSSGIGSANVTREARDGQDDDRAATLHRLVPAAAAHLDALGFLTRQPQVY